MLMPAAEPVYPPEHEPLPLPRHRAAHVRPDPFVQSQPVPVLMPSVAVAFKAQGDGFNGPQGSFSITGVPPDTNGDIGPHHYVQTVNSHLTVFDRSGKALYGPVPINTLFK